MRYADCYEAGFISPGSGFYSDLNNGRGSQYSLCFFNDHEALNAYLVDAPLLNPKHTNLVMPRV